MTETSDVDVCIIIVCPKCFGKLLCSDLHPCQELMESVGSHGQLITAICKECMQFFTISFKFVSVWVFSSDVWQDFYNLLQHETSSDPSSYGTSLEKTAARHLRVTQTANLTQVMNGPIRKKLGIIPSTVR